MLGPPLTSAACGPLDAHEIANAVGVTATSSLNVITTFASSATSFWLASGVVSVTVGAGSAGGPPHGMPPLAAPGVEATRTKSTLLSFVSQPSGTRLMLSGPVGGRAAVSVGALVPSEYPGTKPS